MITQEQAAAIAFHVVGAPPGDPRRGWDLTEFGAGWLITERGRDVGRNRPTRVIERDSGHLVSFPPSIPPARIMADYERVRGSGSALPGGPTDPSGG